MTAPRTTIPDVEPLAERWVRLTFGHGAVHDVDLDPDVLRDEDAAHRSSTAPRARAVRAPRSSSNQPALHP